MKFLRCTYRGEIKSCDFVATGQTEAEAEKAIQEHLEKEHSSE
jgi:predicted small metal-binding protein